MVIIYPTQLLIKCSHSLDKIRNVDQYNEHYSRASIAILTFSIQSVNRVNLTRPCP